MCRRKRLQDEQAELEAFAAEAAIQVALLGFAGALNDDLKQLGRILIRVQPPCGVTFQPPA